MVELRCQKQWVIGMTGTGKKSSEDSASGTRDSSLRGVVVGMQNVVSKVSKQQRQCLHRGHASLLLLQGGSFTKETADRSSSHFLWMDYLICG